MRRSYSSTSIAEIEREKKVRNWPTKTGGEKKKEVYGVCEFVTLAFIEEKRHFENGYDIYKLDDSVDSSSSVVEKKEPFYTLKLGDHNPMSMFIFSMGSKIYFCGGFWFSSDSPFANYSRQAYIFDVQGQGTPIPIQPMINPKPCPLVLGPDHNSKFYVFSSSLKNPSEFIPASFEILDATTNTWESLPLPSTFEFEGVISSVLCGSNILLFNGSSVFVFSTKSKIWHEIDNGSIFNEARISPFSALHYLGATKNTGHILLGYPSHSASPELYSYKPNNDDFEDIGPFIKLGEVEGFPKQHWVWRSPLGVYYLDHDSLCIVSTEDPYHRRGYDVKKLSIDVYNISYSGLDDTEVEMKAKVKNFVQYHYVCKRPMTPTHFFVVG